MKDRKPKRCHSTARRPVLACHQFAAKMRELCPQTNIKTWLKEVGLPHNLHTEMVQQHRHIYLDYAFIIARALNVSLDFLANDALGGKPEAPVLVSDEVVKQIKAALEAQLTPKSEPAPTARKTKSDGHSTADHRAVRRKRPKH